LFQEINKALKPDGESEKKPKPETRWALLTAVGSFVLYLFGYLTLRFRLSTFGIATDLAVLDERYLFAGAQFLVYFLTAIPIVLLPLLLLLPFRRRLNLFCIAGSRNRIGC
jgi:hypothetical protein